MKRERETEKANSDQWVQVRGDPSIVLGKWVSLRVCDDVELEDAYWCALSTKTIRLERDFLNYVIIVYRRR